MAADVMNDLVESKETPAEISTQAGPIGLDPGPIGFDSLARSHSTDSTKDDPSAKGNHRSTKTTVTKSHEPIWVTVKTESLGEADKATERDSRTKEMTKGEQSGPQATNVEPMLQTKEQLLFKGESIEVQQEVEDHLEHSKLEEMEGLERLEASLLDDVMTERSAETERYGKIERESLMSEHSNPNQRFREFDANAFQYSFNDVSENDIRAASGQGMAATGMFGTAYKYCNALMGREPGNTERRLVSVVFGAMEAGAKVGAGVALAASEVTNWVHEKLIEMSPSTRYEENQAYLENSKNDPKNDGSGLKDFFRRPAPDGTDSETPLPTHLVREAMVKFDVQYRQQPWLGISGQPVPGSDIGTPLDFHSAAQVFGQLGRQKWNPMIVQPGPEGDMESHQAGAKEASRNVGAMKMAMAGQPNPEDPDWGTSDGGKGGPSGAVTFNPQPVTTQRGVDGAEHILNVEQHED